MAEEGLPATPKTAGLSRLALQGADPRKGEPKLLLWLTGQPEEAGLGLGADGAGAGAEGKPRVFGCNGTVLVLDATQGWPSKGTTRGGTLEADAPRLGAGIEALSARKEGAKELPMAG